ncbi:hypothetical protein HUE56_21475 [Azospirillum oryzae]|uniref:Uncharacterized protein n=1 Tax=Azospirillum oryzae TaxID=286727 RepID=A0A6N1ANA0_9PROT|nr:hypothetical protein [Azospirillum oryzae]KAA0590555.1 hypothetical protein FZ938_00110 [Azospirillum oryzae]QKS52919.1 hypothetical protein HUE56_21475 [Azospirillum oryzae]GLR80138.1 hypothetical protein GCM10007856_28150 [Azospirillum oryzae]
MTQTAAVNAHACAFVQDNTAPAEALARSLGMPVYAQLMALEHDNSIPTDRDFLDRMDSIASQAHDLTGPETALERLLVLHYTHPDLNQDTPEGRTLAAVIRDLLPILLPRTGTMAGAIPTPTLRSGTLQPA